MFVDPAVSRAKFDREVAEFRAQQGAHHSRGVWLLEAAFPHVFLALIGTKTPPITVAFGALINFENYDIEPPSVKFIHPITRQPLKAADLPNRMPRFKLIRGPDGQPQTGPAGEQLIEPQDLVQAEDPRRPGFVCLQGVREYHEHPAHTGDSWWLHRGTGVGRLTYLVNVLASYGIDQIQQLNFQLKINGYVINPRPE